MDGLPAALYTANANHYNELMPLGYLGADNQYYIYNHLHFRIQTKPTEGGFNIVAFAVEPLSIDHDAMSKQEKLLENKLS